jgi:hypothetical protein
VENQIKADEQSDDPQARPGPLAPDEDAKEQIDHPVEQNPGPGGEPHGERKNDAQHPAHEETRRQQEREDSRRPRGILEHEQADEQVKDGGEQVQCEAFRLRTITAWITSVIPATSNSTPKTITEASVAMKAELIARRPTITDTRPRASQNHQVRPKLANSSEGPPVVDVRTEWLTMSRSFHLVCPGTAI